MTTCCVLHLPGMGTASRSSRVRPRIASASCSPPASYLSMSVRSNGMALTSGNLTVRDKRKQRENAAQQCQHENHAADIAPAALSAGADCQAPGNPRRPESIGQVEARGENADRVNDPRHEPEPPQVMQG